MQAMVCELCGSNDIVKQDGLFVCQHCGTKYSLEEARKMLGIVKIDTSEELKSLYELARRARDNNDSENAQKYYSQILIKDASSWEANFYSVYYQSLQTNIAGICGAAAAVTNYEGTVFKLIKDTIEDESTRRDAVREVAFICITMAKTFHDAATHFFNKIDAVDGWRYLGDYEDRCIASIDLVYHCGNHIESLFDEDLIMETALPCWKTGISYHQALYNKYFWSLDGYQTKEMNLKKINEYTVKIQKYDPSFETPRLYETKKKEAKKKSKWSWFQ